METIEVQNCITKKHMKSKIPYTGGGGTGPHTNPFKVVFKKDIPKHNIKAGDESEAFIQRMVKLDGIMIYPPYGKPHFYICASSEDEVLDTFEFPDMPEYNSTPPPVEPGTEVELPY